ncbi:alpha/beta fold hydrolase [Spirosoma sp. HMF3257]|uniref:Alpha/beta hydrolase n=1 Tax=Spirosoma telluris TaxID=2183553 RepID=A0A327NP54_9BACT|nr:alpha/beta fold hydrolase [Spirosoma telluris]RAI77181.1 alpha/beta hydrolase [Spirosoma telluris]
MNRYSMRASLFLVFLLSVMHAQGQPGVVRTLEPCACPVPIDSSFHTRCAYLIVPENRKKKNGKTIKLPFILVESKNPNKKKDPLLFTGGGPGGSSLGWARGVTHSSIINDRDCIAFEQRGTYFALPRLSGTELDDAIRESYRKNLNKDSMMVVGTKRYKKALEAKGIDLAGYNTDETVSDIHDLLATLRVDSVNLAGISYSGGLMLAVLQKDPSRIRSLVLDSPLPTFVPIDEDEPANFNESLTILFGHVEKDSTNKALYGNLKERFQHYFSSIGEKTFSIPYVEKGTTDTLHIQYTRRDLLAILVNTPMKHIPYTITEMIKGNHYPYIKRVLDDIFEHSTAPSGMRISVYCADQTAYHSEKVLQQFYEAYPYLKGYHINDVYKELCDCWQVPPIKPETKQPFYSNKPALLADGELDNACRPLYIDQIHHYMPNSQRLLFINKAHGVGGQDMSRFMQLFLDNPYRKIESTKKEIIAY